MNFYVMNIYCLECPSGVPVSMCSGNPCEGKHCATDRTAVCKPSFCGGCFAKFYDSKGEEVKCDSMFLHTMVRSYK